jgi:hypothetical protein
VTRFARLVIRVPPAFGTVLDDLGERLFMETAYAHSRAAVVRGLLRLGLLAIAHEPEIAPRFDGVRIPRGRRKHDT